MPEIRPSSEIMTLLKGMRRIGQEIQEVNDQLRTILDEDKFARDPDEMARLVLNLSIKLSHVENLTLHQGLILLALFSEHVDD